MAQRQKVNQVMTGIGLLMLGVLALIFTLYLALTPSQGGTTVSPLLGEYHFNSLTLDSPIANAFLWFLIPSTWLFCFHGGIWRIRDGVKMRPSTLDYQPQTFWSKIATFLQFRDILNTGFFLLLFLVLLVFSMHEFWYAQKAFTVNLFFYVLAVVIYVFTRKKIADIWASFKRKMQKGLPTYTLTEDGLTIKLVTMWNKKQPDPPPVQISFKEIDDLLVLTFIEAEAFLRYNIGPDLNISVQQAKDYAQYVKGKIPRPSVYTFGAPANNDMNVVIRGPKLFYMLTFDTNDVSDLIEAYRSYKESAENSSLQ